MCAAKTSFLFKPHSISAENYLKMGDKAEVPMHELRGILPAIKNIEKSDNIVYESCRLEMKNRKFSRGLVLLANYCSEANYRANFAYGIVLLLKQLENHHMKKDEEYFSILYQLIVGNGCIKYEILGLYLEYIRYYKSLQQADREKFERTSCLDEFNSFYGEMMEEYEETKKKDPLKSREHERVM